MDETDAADQRVIIPKLCERDTRGLMGHNPPLLVEYHHWMGA